MPDDLAPVDLRDQRIADLEAQLRQALARIAELQQQVTDWQARLTEAERAGKRQATPFARKEHTAQRKRPGRKAGRGRFAYRGPAHAGAGHGDQDSPVAEVSGLR